METSEHKTQLLAKQIRELAALLGQTGRGHAASLLDEEAGALADRKPARGLSALSRANALRAGLAAADDAADQLERGAPERARLRALSSDINRALRAS